MRFFGDGSKMFLSIQRKVAAFRINRRAPSFSITLKPAKARGI
jgi:hypothetical protein